MPPHYHKTQLNTPQILCCKDFTRARAGGCSCEQRVAHARVQGHMQQVRPWLRTHACTLRTRVCTHTHVHALHTRTLCTCTLCTHISVLSTHAHAPNPDAPPASVEAVAGGRQDAARGAGTDLGRGAAAAGRRRMSWLARRGFVRAFMRARCSSCLACSCRGLSSSSCPGTKALQPHSRKGD